MKKLISIILALTLVLSLSAAALAAGDGSITINGVTDGTVYSIYKLMDLESFEKDAAYSYKVNSDWTEFFSTGAGKDYVSIDSAGYVTWTAAEDETTKVDFTQAALAYAKSKPIDPVKTSATAGHFTVTGTTGVFEGLELGWYLVDSTAGALCGLTTTDKHAEINAKNGVPTIDKQVQEDLTGMWGDVNTADIGQIVNFMSIIHVAAGAENYVLHDKMSSNLSFVQDLSDTDHNKWRGVTLIEHYTSGGTKSELTLGTDYTVKTSGFGDGCTFEVIFSDALVEDLKANERIIVYYNAMLNRHADTGVDGVKNPNESWLEYGEDHSTTHDQTETHTFEVDIVKTTSSNKLLKGAKFKIYDASVGGNEVKVVPLMNADDTAYIYDSNGNHVYRRARADETGVEIEVLFEGPITIKGFDNGVYYLEETKAPDGYNKLTSRQEFTVADANVSAVFGSDGVYSTGSGVQVVNKTGTMLPETGAEGTFLFVALGMILVLGTGVLLVTKKRMSMIVE